MKFYSVITAIYQSAKPDLHVLKSKRFLLEVSKLKASHAGAATLFNYFLF